jgi:hypothetical protein
MRAAPCATPSGARPTAAVTRSVGDGNAAAPVVPELGTTPLTSGDPMLVETVHVSDRPCPVTWLIRHVRWDLERAIETMRRLTSTFR